MNRAESNSRTKKGRTSDWDQPAESRIRVPYKLADRKQKKALVEIWSILAEAELDLANLVEILNQKGIHLIHNYGRCSKQQLYQKYSTAVAASFGVVSSSDADAGGYEEVDLISELIRAPDRTILLDVVGDSMQDDGIYPGSLLVVETCDSQKKPWLSPNDRDYVIALLNGNDLTVKQFRKDEQHCYLVPRNRKNPKHQPILIQETDEENSSGATVKILGIVKSVTQKL